MERPIIMLNTDNMPVFCRNQCANTKYHGGKGNDARKRMQVLRILRKLRKAGKIHEVYGLQRAAAGSRQTES